MSSGYEVERTAKLLIREPNVSFLPKPYAPRDLVRMPGALLDGIMESDSPPGSECEAIAGRPVSSAPHASFSV